MINIGIHDVDKISLRDTETLSESGEKVRTLVVKARDVTVRIALFSSDPKALEFKLEG